MRTVHDTRHEEALIAGAAGHGGLPEALQATGLGDCQECRAFVRELEDVERRIVRAGSQRRVLMTAAASAEPSAGEERAWHAILAGTVEKAKPRRYSARWWIAAAALLLSTVYFGQRWLQPKESVPNLGPVVSIEIVRPAGEVDAFPPFVWRAVRPPHGWYVVRIEGRHADGSPFEQVSSHLTESRWDLTPRDPRGWPAAIRWDVEIYDASGSLQEVRSSLANRKDP